MSTDEYTPTTEDVCDVWQNVGGNSDEFYRWLAALPLPERIVNLIRDLTDPDECWFDHHGGCQAHGYLSLEPGEKCPHTEAKEVLRDATPTTDPNGDLT